MNIEATIRQKVQGRVVTIATSTYMSELFAYCEGQRNVTVRGTVQLWGALVPAYRKGPAWVDYKAVEFGGEVVTQVSNQRVTMQSRPAPGVERYRAIDLVSINYVDQESVEATFDATCTYGFQLYADFTIWQERKGLLDPMVTGYDNGLEICTGKRQRVTIVASIDRDMYGTLYGTEFRTGRAWISYGAGAEIWYDDDHYDRESLGGADNVPVRLR